MILSEADMVALWLSMKLAAISTLLLLIIGVPIAWWLSTSRSRLQPLVDALVALPLVLPPTVLGFYLLLMFSPSSTIGNALESSLGVSLAFSFEGLVIGSVVYSLPFVVQPLQSAFAGVRREYLETAMLLGASRLDRWLSVILPITKTGFLSAVVLGFAHTLGEFGVVLMIGGNIPGETQLVSIAIYEHVESLEFAAAHNLSLALLVISFVLLLGLYAFNRNSAANLIAR